MQESQNSEIEILFRDPSMLALNKPAGLPVQPDPSGDPSLFDRAATTLGRKPYLVHRLDRPVSGAVLFAVTRKAAAELSRLFQIGGVHKSYWAIVDSPPPKTEGTVEHDILFDHSANRSRAKTRSEGDIGDSAAKASGHGSGNARLEYRVVGESDRYWFLEIVPATGRHHQIRAQLAAIGCHIKGDIKYGARRTNPGGGILLHARSLSLSHPATGEQMLIIAPPPQDPLWVLFQAADSGA